MAHKDAIYIDLSKADVLITFSWDRFMHLTAIILYYDTGIYLNIMPLHVMLRLSVLRQQWGKLSMMWAKCTDDETTCGRKVMLLHWVTIRTSSIGLLLKASEHRLQISYNQNSESKSIEMQLVLVHSHFRIWAWFSTRSWVAKPIKGTNRKLQFSKAGEP